MSFKSPKMWIMKITPGGIGNTKKYFENLFVNPDAKNLIGYTKEAGDKKEDFLNLWNRIKIGDLIIVIEGFNRVYGVVEVTSDAFDGVSVDGGSLSDWFYHRRTAELVQYFNPHLVAKSNTNRNTIIEYSGDGARDICDMVWGKVKDDYWKQKQIKEMQDKIDLLEYKKQIILQGPPGTGKTRMAKMMAEEMTKTNKIESPIDLIDNHFKSYKPDTLRLELRAEINELVKSFQQKFKKDELKNLPLENYALGTEDKDGFCYWLEYVLTATGKYAGQADKGKIYWKSDEQKYVKSGFLKNIIDDEEAMGKMGKLLDNIVSERNTKGDDYPIGKGFVLKILNSYFPDKYFPINNEKPLTNVLKLMGEKTEGLDYIQKNIRLQEIFLEKKEKFDADMTNNEFMQFLFNNFSIKKEVKVENNELIVEGKYKIIQFHPAYSYEDFVRGISAKTNDIGDVSYKVENRILAEFAEEAFDNPKGKYILIIDEINRANLPSVLGELIYALEYRFNHEKDNKKEASVESVYNISENEEEPNRVILLPDNLYIIGTMNTADRSVGHVDYAIKRRFAFVEILPTADAIDDVVKDATVNAKAKLLFQKVSDLFNEDTTKTVYLQSDFKAKEVQLGHSYFLAETEKQLELKLEFEIKPLLNEYVKDGILSASALAEIQNL